MPPHIGRVWDRSHHRVSRKLTGRQPWRGKDGVWVYPLPKDATEEAGFQEVETYVSLLHNTSAQFIAARTSMDLFLAEDQRPGSRVAKR